MILDSSAVVAVICREPGYENLLWKIADASVVAIGAPTVAESQMVISIKLGDGGVRVNQLLSQVQALVVPFTREHVSIFFDAFERYGKGRHPARLNMGDCFTYAIARAAGMKVLCIGDDFSRTDLELA